MSINSIVKTSPWAGPIDVVGQYMRGILEIPGERPVASPRNIKLALKQSQNPVTYRGGSVLPLNSSIPPLKHRCRRGEKLDEEVLRGPGGYREKAKILGVSFMTVKRRLTVLKEEDKNGVK